MDLTTVGGLIRTALLKIGNAPPLKSSKSVLLFLHCDSILPLPRRMLLNKCRQAHKSRMQVASSASLNCQVKLIAHVHQATPF